MYVAKKNQIVQKGYKWKKEEKKNSLTFVKCLHLVMVPECFEFPSLEFGSFC